jgi:hypothetical protein
MTAIRTLCVLAVVVAAGSPAAAQVQQVPAPPVIVTRGEATVKRAPDRAWLTIATETRASRAEEARRTSADVMTEVQKAVRGAGIPGDAIRTVGYSLTPEIRYNNGRGEIRGYVVRNRIEVRVDDLARLGPVIDATQTQSGTGLSIIGPRFDLKDEQGAQNEALRMAVQAARSRAEAMASGAGRSLGPIVRIEESGGPVRPFPAQEMAFRTAAVASDAPETPVTPGEIEVRAEVTLTIEIR